MPKVRYDGKNGTKKGVPVKRTMRIGSRKSGKAGVQMSTEDLTKVAEGKGKNAVKARKILALRSAFRNK